MLFVELIRKSYGSEFSRHIEQVIEREVNLFAERASGKGRTNL